MNRFSRYQIATAVACLFHLIGLAGILFIDKNLFVRATTLNLLLMFFLLLYTQRKVNAAFILFFIGCFITGVGVELVGTRTALLFGSYVYGDVLGPKLYGVPMIIGLNWFIIIYCCGVAILALYKKILSTLPETETPRPVLKMASVVFDGAMLAVFFDWVMEPVAVKLGYWSWQTDNIPLYNYVCWFVISALLLMLFHISGFEKQNKFAVNLLLIQLMFFLLLRSLL